MQCYIIIFLEKVCHLLKVIVIVQVYVDFVLVFAYKKLYISLFLWLESDLLIHLTLAISIYTFYMLVMCVAGRGK